MPGFAVLQSTSVLYKLKEISSLANFLENVDMSMNVLGVVDCNDVRMN
jgi:hypothetical protein